jgi:Family of unknown function (DUF6518)
MFSIAGSKDKLFFAPPARSYPPVVGYVLALVMGLILGAADQYLGSRVGLGAWAGAVSQMSAPWLILPFLAGTTQVRARKAMVLGFVITVGALLGYFAMTYSPWEGFPLSRLVPGVSLMMRTGYNPLWIAGGMIGGPLFGFLGQRWRTRTWWVSAVAVAFILCLEPFARGLIGWPTTKGPSMVESTVGVIAAVSFLAIGLAARRTRLQSEPVGSRPPSR